MGATVHGYVEPGFEPVARLFARLFRSRARGGGSLVVRHHDRAVVDIWAGYADPRVGTPWQRDTLALSFSTSKGVAATVIHRLAERGLIAYDEPVAAFWPEFAAGGKGRITVAQLMSHQAGLDNLAPIAPTVAALLDHRGAEERLAAQTPGHRPGTPAYHAITFGWLMAGLARAVTGRGMEELVRTEVAEPLGVDGFHFGLPAGAQNHVAALVGSLGRLPALGPIGLAVFPAAFPPRRGLQSAYVRGVGSIFRGHRPAVLETVMPAANGLFTAESLATLYGALASGGVTGGRRLLSADTVRALGRVQTRARDRNLVIPMNWRLGFHQAFVPGVVLPKAFGHFGYAGSGAWADPVSGMSVAFVSNRIYPVSVPMGDLALYRLSRLAVTAVRRAGGAVPRVDEVGHDPIADIPVPPPIEDVG